MEENSKSVQKAQAAERRQSAQVNIGLDKVIIKEYKVTMLV